MAPIDIYTTRYCPYCQDAKELLSRKGVSFHEIDVTGNREVRKEMIARTNGRSTYPQIFIGPTHIGGWARALCCCVDTGNYQHPGAQARRPVRENRRRGAGCDAGDNARGGAPAWDFYPYRLACDQSVAGKGGEPLVPDRPARRSRRAPQQDSHVSRRYLRLGE